MSLHYTPAHGTDEVLYALADGVGHILLNRPKAINALTMAMIESMTEQLSDWATDPGVERVELAGAGERGLCAGADVRVLREQALTEPHRVLDFLEAEYRLNSAIADYPKPYLAHMDGITMGGGMGLSVHGRRRLGTADTKIAMPETIIGLFPDVGVLYELSRAPRQAGAYLAMLGATIDAPSALWAGLLDEVAGGEPVGTSRLEQDAGWIEECFAGRSAAEIVGRLEQHTDERAREAGAELRLRSPLSVCISLEALRRAETMSSVDEVLAQDLAIAYAMFGPDGVSDFAEGVRAQLVDKDRQPRWRHARIENVTQDEVAAAFTHT